MLYYNQIVQIRLAHRLYTDFQYFYPRNVLSLFTFSNIHLFTYYVSQVREIHSSHRAMNRYHLPSFCQNLVSPWRGSPQIALPSPYPRIGEQGDSNAILQAPPPHTHTPTIFSTLFIFHFLPSSCFHFEFSFFNIWRAMEMAPPS